MFSETIFSYEIFQACRKFHSSKIVCVFNYLDLADTFSPPIFVLELFKWMYPCVSCTHEESGQKIMLGINLRKHFPAPSQRSLIGLSLPIRLYWVVVKPGCSQSLPPSSGILSEGQHAQLFTQVLGTESGPQVSKHFSK